MADAYRRIYLHLVFAVANRRALLGLQWRNEVFKYIAGILNNKGHYSLAINGYNDHIHIFFDYNVNELVPDLVREIKKSSSNFIRKKRFTRYKFNWQNGYGIFSHSNAEKGRIINYIRNQEEHHRKITFKEEYLEFLRDFEIDYNSQYLLDFFDIRE